MEDNKNKITLVAEIIGIIGGIISIISFILQLLRLNNTDSLLGVFNSNPLYPIILFSISCLILITVTIRKKNDTWKNRSEQTLAFCFL